MRFNNMDKENLQDIRAQGKQIDAQLKDIKERNKALYQTMYGERWQDELDRVHGAHARRTQEIMEAQGVDMLNAGIKSVQETTEQVLAEFDPVTRSLIRHPNTNPQDRKPRT
jgi:hypothetical protein